MSQELSGFVHRFEPGRDGASPLLLLHGTGGDETDLLPLGRSVAPGAPLLSPRGAVLENGMPRFFRRLAEGVFDEADLRRRAEDLAGFVAAARRAYGLAAPVALGFSNGANVAAALLMLRPGVLAGAALLRPMSPFEAPPRPDLAGTPVLILSGLADPIVPARDAERLAGDLAASGASVDHRVLPAGHGLSRADLDLVQAWLAGREPAGRA
jgi:phospholipase/carboxylesterase